MEIPRSADLDVSAIAKKIWDEDMSERQEVKYLDSIWNDGDDNLLRLSFGKKIYFLKQIDNEKMKIEHPGVYREP